ncbi:hypothetical protein [Cupriavidus taiwanensis]|uniref:hypothetical protein n=1 Tax=Cupriavidus taiwanensis TaxID=164546 RepID=UPI0011C05235|nr:hypothetical protein [Cupriavidus taiwanensis]
MSQKNGELTLQQHETDSPIIPVAQLQQLHTFKPEAVDWVIEQTQIEAETRRAEGRRINTLVFVERLLGQIFALAIGLAGVAGGSYVAVHGQPWAGATIATASLTGLAVVFLTGRRGK